MKSIYVFTRFEDSKPLVTYISVNGQILRLDIYQKGTGKSLLKVEEDKIRIKKIFESSLNQKVRIICNDFKLHIKAFSLDLSPQHYNVYCIPDTYRMKIESIEQFISLCDSRGIKEYQKIFANAQIVYEYLEKQKLLLNYTIVNPRYSCNTFSGRSKTLDFCVQGYTEGDNVRTVSSNDSDVVIMFDWLAADIRIASILSNDTNLQNSFFDSDPYTYLMNAINNTSEEKISREECKRFLLKSINSMNMDDDVLIDVFPQLCKWVNSINRKLDTGAVIYSILGRSFSMEDAKNKLAVLNGVMQGSVAHAMQIVLRKIYDTIPSKLITEIHDSIVVNCPNKQEDIKYVINTIVKIMREPFLGYIDKEYVFPVNVSVGSRWKKWKFLKVYK